MNHKLQQKKYKKLLKELLYHRAEVEFQEEIIKEYGIRWQEAQVEFCKARNINIAKMTEENEENLIVMKKNTAAQAKQPKTTNNENFSKIYKQIAKKTHPDKADVDDDETFKAAAKAYHDEDWGKLLEIADRLNCVPQGATKAMLTDMQQQILYLKKQSEVNIKKYAWLYYECDDDQECIENLIKQMLAHVYNYSVS